MRDTHPPTQVLNYLLQAEQVFEKWVGEGDNNGDVRDREPIIGIAQMLQAEELKNAS